MKFDLKKYVYLILAMVLSTSVLIIPGMFFKGLVLGAAFSFSVFASVDTFRDYQKLKRIKGIVKRKTQEPGPQDH